MIKNYIFDLGNVVLILNWNKVLDKYLEITDTDKELLKKNVFESEEWNKLDWGVISKQEAIEIMKNNLPKNLHWYCEDIMSTWTEGLIINNEILDLIQQLRDKGYNTYVLSNAPVEIDIFLKRKDLKKYFDGILISAFDQLIKPDKNIYKLLLNRFNLKADESFFIDDKLENVEAAISVGINAFQFDYRDIEELKTRILGIDKF